MAELHIAFAVIDAGSIVEKALISRQVGRVEAAISFVNAALSFE